MVVLKKDGSVQQRTQDYVLRGSQTNLLGGVQGPALWPHVGSGAFSRTPKLSSVLGVKNIASLCINLEEKHTF